MFDLEVETPLGNQSPPAILPKMCSPELRKKSQKKINKKHLNMIFHPIAGGPLLGRLL